MIGKDIAHYHILRKLGEGGMGVVYLAEDKKLKRQVAIKILPQRIAANDIERRRFEIEAQAAASLNHPNIATIHAIEEYQGQTFLVMEYIEGKELKDSIQEARIKYSDNEELNYSDIIFENTSPIQIALQIAKALQAAHKKGIIHRDIKSANIMITEEGDVKVMDFGLAKVRGTSDVTQAGKTVGTVAYMSPELTRGEEIDQRTDIWSFGVVLYEMLTGQKPFKGEYDLATMFAIVNEQHEPVDRFISDVPEQLTKIIDKCLLKNPENRYNNISEILQEEIFTGHWSGSSQAIETAKPGKSFITEHKTPIIILAGIVLVGIVLLKSGLIIESSDKIRMTETELKRIAVLPLNNINKDPESDYLGFALSDQIISALTYIKELTVRPSNSVRSYQNKIADPADIAERLNVDYILSGSFLKENDKIRLTFELVDIKSNDLIWNDNIDVNFENTFVLQDIVSKNVVDGLKLKFAAEYQTFTEAPVNPVAYEYFLKALSYPLTLDGHKLAIGLFQKSIEIDSTFASAYSELGFRQQLLANYDLDQRDQLVNSEKSYKKALKLNPNLIDALSRLALLYTTKDRAAEALNLIRQSLQLNPNNAETHFWLGYIFRYTGLLEESEDEMEKALLLDPTNPRFRSIGLTYLYQQKYSEAFEGLKLDEGSPYSLAWTGNIYLRQNDLSKAEAIFSSVIAKEVQGSIGLWAQTMLSYIKNEKQKGLETLMALEKANVFDGEQFYNYANLYALYGMKSDCIRLLKKAVDHGFYCYPFMQNDVFLDTVREEQAFIEVLSYARKKHNKFKIDVTKIFSGA